MDVRLSIVKGKGGAVPGPRCSCKLATFAENSHPSIGSHVRAEVAELADAQDLGSCGRKAVGVQLSPFYWRIGSFVEGDVSNLFVRCRILTGRNRFGWLAVRRNRSAAKYVHAAL